MDWIVTTCGLISSVVLISTQVINTTKFNSCFCDLTSATCDVYCCCDQDCSEFQKQSFQCKDVMEQTNKQNDWWCSSNVTTPEKGIFLMLCIEKENSPYLGLHYYDYPVFKDLPSLNSVLQKKIEIEKSLTFKTQIESEKAIKQPIDERGYVAGQNLKIITKNMQMSNLLLPYAVLHSQCDVLRPVQYLTDIYSACLVNVEKSCETNQMNVHSYIIGEGNRQLLGTPGDEVPLQNISVVLYNAKEICCYHRSRLCSSRGCRENKLEPYLHSKPESPMLHQEMCYNSVLEVNYLFHWSGNRIHSLNISIILGDIPLSEGHSISQTFSVAFSHYRNTSRPLREASFSSVGYQMKDFLIGLLPNSEIEGTDTNTSLSKVHLFTWKIDNTCSSGTDAVQFGVDRLSGCIYRIENWDLIDCSILRKNAFKTLSSVFVADFLSRSGSFDQESSLEIIHVMPQSSNGSTNDSDGDNLPAAVRCVDVPHHVRLEVTFGEVVRTPTGSFYKIIAAVKNYSTSTWSMGVKRSSIHHLFSSVQFRYISVEEERRRQKTKRSQLPLRTPWEHAEGTRWCDLLYPLVHLDLELVDRYFRHATNVFVLLVILLASAASYVVLSRHHVPFTSRRA